MDTCSPIHDLAKCYTAAWCSQDPSQVAAHFAVDGSLCVNDGEVALGRDAIAAVAHGFMAAFPDLIVSMDDLLVEPNGIVYRWTLDGTMNGHRVHISGFEEWEINADGLIAQSLGHFDAADYQRQVDGGTSPPLFLDESAVRARLRMPALIEAMQCALVEFSANRVVQPVRTVLKYGEEHALFGLMPTYIPSLPALGAKLVTVCHANAARGLGTHQALIVMLDPATGIAIAILDGRYITEMRTAAVSAVSTRHLARADAKILGIIGSGVQARSHLQALRLVRDFSEVRVWSPNRERLRLFAAEHGCRAMDNAEAVVRGADVVVTLTPSPTLVVENEWVAPGTHVIAVGSCLPTQRELDPALVARARLFVDSRAAALREAGDVVMAIAEGHFSANHIEAELGELPQRHAAAEITVFKSVGLAVEDLFAAHLVLNH